ncbi:hypothetical protein PO864_10555 [Providencia alcalifaciens]|uniref:hypothetical protein n=1 Tax=Providencia alcalifaciens TaxID=126385 RepID=UPI0005691448|nr:hypothetical protein [Providencia alcalifaciens]MTC26853.1 hypothetical protein [Providencia alcalifaciens]WGZ52722.1 hypothetical protein PO864_10555 [Providencia alcalifaciens]
MYSIKPHGVASTNVSRSESINPNVENSANNSEKNGVAVKVCGVFNGVGLLSVTTRVSMDENRAACLITKCLRQVIANKSYNHMFQHGEMWSARADKVQDVFVLYDASNSPVLLVISQAEGWRSQW